MKIVIDYEKCIGIGQCEALAPDLFEIGDDGQATVLQDPVGEDRRELVERAVTSCPTGSISIE